MTQIIWKLPDGEIAITTLVEAECHTEEAERLVAAGLIPDDWNVDHILESDRHFAAEDPDFFAALTTIDREIVVDMVKARQIWRDQIRTARAPHFAMLDIQWQRADESDDADAKAAIIARKCLLRDLTADRRIDEADNILTLRSTWPAALN